MDNNQCLSDRKPFDGPAAAVFAAMLQPASP
jgi:hypothetical protein